MSSRALNTLPQVITQHIAALTELLETYAITLNDVDKKKANNYITDIRHAANEILQLSPPEHPKGKKKKQVFNILFCAHLMLHFLCLFLFKLIRINIFLSYLANLKISSTIRLLFS
jgi:hypothetical protein